MISLIAFNRCPWIEENRPDFESPVGHQVIWEDAQFTAMLFCGPHARRAVHGDPSDAIFDMLKGAMVLEYLQTGTCHAHAGADRIAAEVV